jgi:hypothetical protein
MVGRVLVVEAVTVLKMNRILYELRRAAQKEAEMYKMELELIKKLSGIHENYTDKLR